MLSLQISGFISPTNYQIKNFIETTETITAAVARGVFSAIVSYGKENWPSLVFHAIHFVRPSLISTLTHNNFWLALPWVSLLHLLNLGGNYQNYTKTEVAFQIIQCLATAAIVAELAINILFPPSLAVYVTVRIIVHVAGVIGNSRSIYEGCDKIHQALKDSQLETSKKTELVVSGLISVGLGIFGLNTTAQNATKLYQGLKVYQKLDPTQQSFTLKFYGLESLAETKSQNAVIIYGLSGEWADEGNYYFDNTPSAPAYVISQNYNVRTYQVTSSQHLNSVLQQARKELGSNLDLIAFMGYANNQSMKLNANYDFTGNLTEIKAIQNSLSKKGDILLWGCETAQLNRRLNSLTKFISKCLPDASVTGFDHLLYPSRSWAWFSRQKLHVYSWDKSGIWNSITAIYQNGLWVS